MYKMFGIERPESGDEDSQQNDNGNDGGAAEKLSDVSDVEMKSAEEDEPKAGEKIEHLSN